MSLHCEVLLQEYVWSAGAVGPVPRRSAATGVAKRSITAGIAMGCEAAEFSMEEVQKGGREMGLVKWRPPVALLHA